MSHPSHLGILANPNCIFESSLYPLRVIVDVISEMPGDKLLEQIFNLKFTSKQLSKQSKKCEKDEKAARLSVKKAIEKGNMDGARIYAQNAIRKKNEQLNYLRLASRLDAVVSRLDTQAKMQAVTKSMAGIVKALDKAVSTNNLDKVATTMDQFERQFENLDVQSEFVEQAMSNQMNLSTPEADVNNLLQQVADEHGLDVSAELPGASTATPAMASQAKESEEGDLTRRLAELRGR